LKITQGIDGLNVILLTVPFFYTNFLAFFVPLPNEGRTQWELSACFGDGATKIDMMSVSDLGGLVCKYTLLERRERKEKPSSTHLFIHVCGLFCVLFPNRQLDGALPNLSR
jgi:hypothetical protein